MRTKAAIVAIVFGMMANMTPATVQADTDPLAQRLLQIIMSEDLAAMASFEVAARANIIETVDGALGLGITRNQRRVNNGIRAEVSIDYPFREGDSVHYAWRFLLPPDARGDPGRDRWMIMGQWHDQPDRQRGETWETFTSHSPPVSLGFGEVDGAMAVALAYGATRTGDPQARSSIVTVARDTWHSVGVTVRWSQGADGTATFVMNGTRVAHFEGPNMNNAAPHYFKAGIYRHPGISGDAWIYLSDVTISHR